MKFKLEFKMDNAAFEPEPDTEIVRILKEIIHQINYTSSRERIIFDINGNKIGQWFLMDEY